MSDEHEYHVGYSAHGGLKVEAPPEEFVAAVNEALGNVDTGDLDTPVLDHVRDETTGEVWAQDEARDEGVDF